MKKYTVPQMSEVRFLQIATWHAIRIILRCRDKLEVEGGLRKKAEGIAREKHVIADGVMADELFAFGQGVLSLTLEESIADKERRELLAVLICFQSWKDRQHKQAQRLMAVNIRRIAGASLAELETFVPEAKGVTVNEMCEFLRILNDGTLAIGQEGHSM